MPASLETARRVVEAFNSHDEERIRARYAPDVDFEAPGDVRLQGADAVTGYAMAWLRAFPDARVEVHNELAAGDWVVHEFTFKGTHEETLSGPDGDIPATHRRLEGRGTQVLRFDGDLVVTEHLYFDQVQVLTQLGLMPEPAAAGA